MALSSTQIGALAENLVVNELMIESGGRLTPFQPLADDDGIDVLIYDKVTGRAAPLQIKARTNTLRKRGSEDRGNTAHFEHSKATIRADRSSFLLCVLLDPSLRSTGTAWLIPIGDVPTVANDKGSKYVIRASRVEGTMDRYRNYQCQTMLEVARRLIDYFENDT